MSDSTSRRPDIRTAMDVDSLRQCFLENLFYVQGRYASVADLDDLYLAAAYTVRDRLLERWITTAQNSYSNPSIKMVCYLSAEFLLGPHLENNLTNLGIHEDFYQAMRELGYDLNTLIEREEEPGLGNGGLGRLAACYLDSLATLDVPAIGYGIRYEFGIFDQAIRDGWQVEMTDKWLRAGNPWELPRPGRAVEVPLGGYTEHQRSVDGGLRVIWHPANVVKGVPYDTPILGFKTRTANLLRLWKSEAVESLDFDAFNTGDYLGAVEEKIRSENLSKILYPNDGTDSGRRLRLEQQFFFTCCSIKDILRAARRKAAPLDRLHESYAVQLNDTHPSIGVAELMRQLVDEECMDWERAWEVTHKTFGYTNHTLLPEALERWPVPLFERVLPRHLEIIYEINRRFLEEVHLYDSSDPGIASRVSIIEEGQPKQVRMAHLATVGSHMVNGVAELHSELLKSTVLRDFAGMWPERFTNVTNGVTPRRWLLMANPALSSLINSRIGEGWVKDMTLLRSLEPLADDQDFRTTWRVVRGVSKLELATLVERRLGEYLETNSMFDILTKRIHEYKRQHLKALHIVASYLRLKDAPDADVTPRVFFFGGKAAPGYFAAKLIIKLIHSVAEVVNQDRQVRGRLKVIFLPDFNVTLAQRVYPAADLNEQISLAGLEASGTGNMKFAMNGALTIGTLDGANIEIRREAGEENYFLFGHTAEEAGRIRAEGYSPYNWIDSHPLLRRSLDAISVGTFSRGDRSLFKPLIDDLVWHDRFQVLADFASYMETQDRIDREWGDVEGWTRKSILNVARMGKFSSDRAIQDYRERVWRL
ncbi:MAG TPA: glycogen/starch/alpha-glucan phosphorylase [Bryobacteraceae bacterium]|nr:glycogen/starch/alpha-glucan phosphorylase [Bryobacteraceae bacterium]